MKTPSNQNAGRTNTPPHTMGPINNNKHRPEIRDNLDSREGEEQETKGENVTHNKKEKKTDHLKDHKKR
jgi:hypothetical protein